MGFCINHCVKGGRVKQSFFSNKSLYFYGATSQKWKLSTRCFPLKSRLEKSGYQMVHQGMWKSTNRWMCVRIKRIISPVFKPLSGFPSGSVVKNLPANERRLRRHSFQPLGWEDPLEEKMSNHSHILA